MECLVVIFSDRSLMLKLIFVTDFNIKKGIATEYEQD